MLYEERLDGGSTIKKTWDEHPREPWSKCTDTNVAAVDLGLATMTTVQG